MNIALVLSGGTGSRIGGEIPKQYVKVREKMLITYCVETLAVHERIDGIHIVAEQGWQAGILRELAANGIEPEKLSGFSLPGENRQLSIYHGLEDILQYAGKDSWVLIHDGARPLLSTEQISRCFDEAAGHEGVMPVIAMKDTVYRSRDGKRISDLLDRRTLFAGQAPELFRLDKYYEVNKALLPHRILQINGSTEPAVLGGMDVVMIPGDERNVKVTTREDLDYFRRIMEETNL